MIQPSTLHSNPKVSIYQNQPTNPQYGLFIIHGMAEHGLRYQRFMDDLENENILACTMDLSGHGKSLSPNQAVGILRKEDRFDAILEDLNQWTLEVIKNHPDLKFTLMGHSMGSIFARRLAANHPDRFKQMIWMGTLPYFSPLKIGFIRILAGLISSFYPVNKRNHTLSFLLNHPLEKKHPGRAFNWLSKNQDNVDGYLADDAAGYVYNSRFYRWFFKLIQEVNQRNSIKKTTLEAVYIIAGTHDPVIGSPAALKQLMKRYEKIKTSYYFVPQARHEVLNEGMKEVDTWLIGVIRDEWGNT